MTSASAAISFTILRPSGSFKLTERLRLLRLKVRNWVLSPFTKGVHLRVSSPPVGSSILTTSAPISPINMVQKGPASVRVRSTTLILSNAPAILFLLKTSFVAVYPRFKAL